MASAWQTLRIFKTVFSFVLDRDSPYGAQNESKYPEEYSNLQKNGHQSLKATK